MTSNKCLRDSLYENKDEIGKIDELIFDCTVNIDYYERALLKERDLLMYLNKVRKIYHLEEKKVEEV